MGAANAERVRYFRFVDGGDRSQPTTRACPASGSRKKVA